MTHFASFAELRTACLDLPGGDEAAAAAARQRDARLTKPPGSLGRLEELVAWLARWQGRYPPRLDGVAVLVFAGNHGVVSQGVSAFPAEVTGQMVANFAAGGAAINQLAAIAGASLRVIPLALDRPTADFTTEPAMDERGFLDAVAAGYAAVPPEADLVCLGEMGIGNTTAAAAVAAALFGGGGGGTGRAEVPAWTRPGSPASAMPSTGRSRVMRRSPAIRCGSRRRSGAASLPRCSAPRWRRGGSIYRW